MEYETIQYETWLGDDNLLKQIKIIKTWNDDNLINTITLDQSKEEIQVYLDGIKKEQNNN